MIAVDTNILIYAHREELPQHQEAMAWLRYLAEGTAPWAIPVFCLGEFVRVITHPRIFDPPTPSEIALEALSGLLESPTVKVLNPGLNYPSYFRNCVMEADARSNLAFDAQIAAVCREYGVSRVLTADRDFARFGQLRLLAVSNAPPSQI